jgi:hypothetical protein
MGAGNRREDTLTGGPEGYVREGSGDGYLSVWVPVLKPGGGGKDPLPCTLK